MLNVILFPKVSRWSRESDDCGKGCDLLEEPWSVNVDFFSDSWKLHSKHRWDRLASHRFD